MALRCIKNGTRSQVCDLHSLMGDEVLADTVTNGHSWWILPESLPTDMQTDISFWKNQDQNENQQVHEIEVLQTLRNVAEGFLKSGMKSVLPADLMAGAKRKNPAPVSDKLWKTLARYYLSYLHDKEADMIEDLADYHSEKVDPREVTVGEGFFAMMMQGAFKGCPCLRHYLVATQYSKEKVLHQSTGPAIGHILDSELVTSFAKNADVVAETEKHSRT